MAKNAPAPTPVSLRVPPDLLAQVDAWAEKTAAYMGVPVSRSAAILALLVRGLDVGAGDLKKKGPR